MSALFPLTNSLCLLRCWRIIVTVPHPVRLYVCLWPSKWSIIIYICMHISELLTQESPPFGFNFYFTHQGKAYAHAKHPDKKRRISVYDFFAFLFIYFFPFFCFLIYKIVCVQFQIYQPMCTVNHIFIWKNILTFACWRSGKHFSVQHISW